MNSNEALLAAYATSNRINIFLTDHIPDAAWHANQPGGKGRDIASMAAHMHNVRLQWLKSAGKTPSLPAKLEGETCTKAQVIEALNESFEAIAAGSVISLRDRRAHQRFEAVQARGINSLHQYPLVRMALYFQSFASKGVPAVATRLVHGVATKLGTVGVSNKSRNGRNRRVRARRTSTEKQDNSNNLRGYPHTTTRSSFAPSPWVPC